MQAKRMIGWFVLAALALTIVLFGAGYAVIHTRGFNRWVLGKVIEEAQKSTGGRVEIRSMDVDWKSLDVDFYGISMYGGPAGGAPFLRAEHLRVGVKIVSL